MKCISNIIFINLLSLNFISITKHGSWIALGLSISSDKPPDIGEVTHKYHLNFNRNLNFDPGEVDHKYPGCDFAANPEPRICTEDLRQENAILYKLLYTAIAKAENAEKSLNQVLQENKFLKMAADATRGNAQNSKGSYEIRTKTDTKAQYRGSKRYEDAIPTSMKYNTKHYKDYRSYAAVCGDTYKGPDATKMDNYKRCDAVRVKTQKLLKSDKTNLRNCKFCGNRHIRGAAYCKQYGKTCSKCFKKNHCSAMCRNTVKKIKTARSLGDEFQQFKGKKMVKKKNNCYKQQLLAEADSSNDYSENNVTGKVNIESDVKSQNVEEHHKDEIQNDEVPISAIVDDKEDCQHEEDCEVSTSDIAVYWRSNSVNTEESDSEVNSEDEAILRKICNREFTVDEKYEEYEPKVLKSIYAFELSLIKQNKKKIKKKMQPKKREM